MYCQDLLLFLAIVVELSIIHWLNLSIKVIYYLQFLNNIKRKILKTPHSDKYKIKKLRYLWTIFPLLNKYGENGLITVWQRVKHIRECLSKTWQIFRAINCDYWGLLCASAHLEQYNGVFPWPSQGICRPLDPQLKSLWEMKWFLCGIFRLNNFTHCCMG